MDPVHEVVHVLYMSLGGLGEIRWHPIVNLNPFAISFIFFAFVKKYCSPSFLLRFLQALTLIYSSFLAPDSSHTMPESPKVEKSGSFTGRSNSTDRGDEVDGRTKLLVKKQDTEEEDIDELVRTFRESEAAAPKDVGDAGKYDYYR